MAIGLRVPAVAQPTPEDSVDEGQLSFLDLPRELRDQIYAFAINKAPTFQDEFPDNILPICLTHRNSTVGMDIIIPRVMNTFRALCGVSHQVRAEAIDTFSSRIALDGYMPEAKDICGIREVLEPTCMCPFLLRHARSLRIDRSGALPAVMIDFSWKSSNLRVNITRTRPYSMLSAEDQLPYDTWTACFRDHFKILNVGNRFSPTFLHEVRRSMVAAQRMTDLEWVEQHLEGTFMADL